MKKITSTLLAVGIAISSVSVMAMDDSKNMNMKSMDMKSMDMKMMDPKMMDKDGDGMISKSEFMEAHEMMFDRMKNSDGMISVKDMQNMKHHMMKHHMMKGGATMPDDNPNGKNMLGITKP